MLWCEYMVRFKTLFECYHAQKLSIADVDDFLAWIHEHKNSRVFVHDRFDLYFPALKQALRDGTDWLHFNLEWEDAYIRKHKDLLG